MERFSPTSAKSIRASLWKLSYELEYLHQFYNAHCFVFFEYKYETLSKGIYQLHSLQLTAPPEFQEEISELFNKYNYAFQNHL